ncbi:threonine synthase [Candidatus Fukatsuia symbiotica]|uniref:Threonine synthase n=1 Tax=Candidatus Fukatsuia symbiotica TaxID=1878942 RepID=A0A2U8I3X8_9GAMM|nr:threonine synthase [Candidatus Fukatsuia symbiotica]AWK13840.1 threonine synthase [Candidatus Fukatsuia symbiotica]MEA9446043.1 threonine synthase [Candidatus Fukatsuia symbiotica]
MKLYNLKDHKQHVSFIEALQQGLGKQQGLFFPLELPEFTLTEIEDLLKQDFITRSSRILSAFIGDEIVSQVMTKRVEAAFTFPAPLVMIGKDQDVAALELFHGPTLAFKDFGARFMAQMLAEVATDQPVTILTATSGDTGAAVAHAFYGLKNVRVVILYPRGKISPLQEKLFCTLGGNIHTVAIDGDFDACQALVKQAFDDTEVKETLSLNSANSINISRLLAQICYYFEAVAQLPVEARKQLVISVPSGNFGNLTAGLLAKSLGLPIRRFIAATNANDTVPRFLKSGQWQPNQTVATLSNAMDVSSPNNWPRIEELFHRKIWRLKDLAHGTVSDQETKETMRELADLGYISEPHTAIAYRVLRDQLQEGEFGLFLGTAHPAKFKESVEDILQQTLPLPQALETRATLPLLSHHLPAKYTQLRAFLLASATSTESIKK